MQFQEKDFIEFCRQRLRLSFEEASSAWNIYITLWALYERMSKSGANSPTPANLGGESPPSENDENSRNENIQLMIDLFMSNNDSSLDFLLNFGTWKYHRKETIKSLKDILKSMDTDRTVCNVIKIASGTVGVVAGTAIIGSLLFPPAAPVLLPGWLGGAAVSALLPSFLLPTTVAVTSPLAIGGGIAAGAAGATSLGTAAAEIGLLKKRIEDAKKVCDKDRKIYRYLERWFKRNAKLKEAMTKLIDFSILEKIFKHLDNLKEEFDGMHSNTAEFQVGIRVCGYFIFNEVLPMSEAIEVAVLFATTLISLILFRLETRSILRCVFLAHNLGLGLVRAAEGSVEIAKIITSMVAKGTTAAELIPRALATKVAFGAMAGFGIAIDATSIVLSTIDLVDGKMSEEEKRITDVIKMLEKELVALEKVHAELVLKLH